MVWRFGTGETQAAMQAALSACVAWQVAMRLLNQGKTSKLKAAKARLSRTLAEALRSFEWRMGPLTCRRSAVLLLPLRLLDSACEHLGLKAVCLTSKLGQATSMTRRLLLVPSFERTELCPASQ